MILIFLFLLFYRSYSQTKETRSLKSPTLKTQTFEIVTLNELHLRLLSMENKIDHLESEIKSLKAKNQDLESEIELKEVQADVSYILMEQVKLIDRKRAHCHTILIRLRLLALVRLENLEADKLEQSAINSPNEYQGGSNIPVQFQVEFSGEIFSSIII